MICVFVEILKELYGAEMGSDSPYPAGLSYIYDGLFSYNTQRIVGKDIPVCNKDRIGDGLLF